MLTHKSARVSLYIFAVIVIISWLSITPVLGQDNKKAPEASETAKQAEELLQKALALCNTKELVLGRDRLLEAMGLWMQMRQPEKAARAALQMGDCYEQRRSYKDSLYYYKRALNVNPVPGSVKAISLNCIARVYAKIFQNDLALHYYKRAFGEANKTKDIPAQTVAATGMSNIYYLQGKRDEAIVYFNQAQKLNRESDDPEIKSALLHLDGQIAQEEGSLERARVAFEDSLAIYRKTDDLSGQVRLLCSISKLSLLSNRNQEALEQAEQAVKLAKDQWERVVSLADDARARESRMIARLSLGHAQRAMGQTEEAIRSLKLGIAYLDGIWWLIHVATEAGASAVRENYQANYRALVDLLVEQGRFAEAYDWAESARMKVLSVFTNARREAEQSEKSDQDEMLSEKSRLIASLRTQLYSSNASSEQKTKLRNDIREAEYAREEAWLKIEMENIQKNRVWFPPASIQQVQEKLLPEKSLLLEFFLGEDRSFVWVISSDGFWIEKIPGRKDIEREVRAYIESISTYPTRPRFEKSIAASKERAEKLFSRLLGSLSRRIESDRNLIVVPDGLLHYLPFEALVHKGRYLLQDHDISYTPSASLLALWQDSGSKATSGDKFDLLAFGDPIFGPKAEGRRDSKRISRNITRQLLDSGNFELPSLPMTRDEVQYIADLFPADRRQVYLDKNSTEEVVKRKSLRSFRRLHFATHGLIDELFPSRSAIILTLDNDPEEDGFLEAREISELDLDCDLVVLSACQTGRGQVLSGEGIIGLSRAFLYAGARSVVVSLWNVSDISTGKLMKSFYQNLTNNIGNAAALRRAKLQMLQSDQVTRHPYFWAPFIIIGKT